MRFVLFTYPDPDYAARSDAMSEEERAASLTDHTLNAASLMANTRSLPTFPRGY